ncbi:MAG: hypothetical protein AAF630_04165 [Cyanobacteria bacterium P01_C01_bin.38]
MKEVLELIEQRKREFTKLPFFEYLGNESIDPKQRLAWVPYISPLVMSFADLWKYDFRKEPANNQLQELINKHTYEDDYHWIWFLEDLEKLGFNYSLKFSDSLRFLWSEKTTNTRLLCHKIGLYTFEKEPFIVVSAIQTMEATFEVVLSRTIPLIKEIQATTNQRYPYFGSHHWHVENNHAMNTEHNMELLKDIQLTENEKIKSFEVVEQLFYLFTESMNELMINAKNYPIKQYDKETNFVNQV